MMMHPSSFIPYQQGTRSVRTAKGAADFLRAHDKMASILPTVTRMVALQKDCAATLPPMFDACAVQLFEAEQLVLSVPNAALAAKLKQQVPKLQSSLLKRGWQVSAIRLKVQVTKNHEKSTTSKRLNLPRQAVSAFAELGDMLEDSPRNAALKAALTAMVRRHRDI
jgi:hypothetical protein